MPYPPTASGVGYLQHDRAGPAAALAAPQLGALEAMLGADEVEEGPVRVWVAQLDPGAIEVEVERGARVGRPDEVLQGISDRVPICSDGGDEDLWLVNDRSRQDHLLSSSLSHSYITLPQGEGPWRMVMI